MTKTDDCNQMDVKSIDFFENRTFSQVKWIRVDKTVYISGFGVFR